MVEAVRFGISIHPELLKKFDALIDAKGYQNRSEAIRDLIRKFLVEKQWEEDEEIIGAVTIVYNHHTRELPDTVTDFQHHHYRSILSSLHVHLDPDNCLEVIVLRGKAGGIRRFADRLIGTRGIKHGTLSATTTGSTLP